MGYGLALTRCDEAMGGHALYRRVLGDGLDRIPEPVRRFHNSAADRVFRGRVRVHRGMNPLARWLAHAFGFPQAGPDQPMELRIRCVDGQEIWQRRIGDRRFATQQRAGQDGMLIESFGPLTVYMRLPLEGSGLKFQVDRLTMFGLTLPAVLTPRVQSRESVGQGRLVIDVDIVAPYLGRIIHYRGWLEPADAGHTGHTVAGRRK